MAKEILSHSVCERLWEKGRESEKDREMRGSVLRLEDKICGRFIEWMWEMHVQLEPFPLARQRKPVPACLQALGNESLSS